MRVSVGELVECLFDHVSDVCTLVSSSNIKSAVNFEIVISVVPTFNSNSKYCDNYVIA